MMSVYCTYGLGTWYGSRLILEKGYDGGKVVTIVMLIVGAGLYVHILISLYTNKVSSCTSKEFFIKA